MSSISALSNQIFRQYDRNGDQAISIRQGQGFEGSHVVRDYQSGYDRDTITVTRYSHDALFKAADADNNGLVTRDELNSVIKLFDTNHDGKLTNSGPFWNRKGELRNFDKAYPERAQILEHHVIPRPQPIIPPVPVMPKPPRALASSAVGVAVA